MTEKKKKELLKLAEKQNKDKKYSMIIDNLDFLIYLVAVVILAFAIRNYCIEPVRVDGTSMTTTLDNNERMFLERFSYMFSKPSRGDIIVCYYPGYAVSCIKRVIGLPGETVKIENGRVYIDGQLLDESDYWKDNYFRTADMEVTLDENHVFVMGDNRRPGGSHDSRSSNVGPIPLNRIEGRVFVTVYPFEKAKLVPKINYNVDK